MQLILDTEPTIDITRDMSTLDQNTLDERLDNVIQELKSGLCNSNKENIQTQDNIITGDDDTNLENDKSNAEDEYIETKSPLPTENNVQISENDSPTPVVNSELAVDSKSPTSVEVNDQVTEGENPSPVVNIELVVESKSLSSFEVNDQANDKINLSPIGNIEPVVKSKSPSTFEVNDQVADSKNPSPVINSKPVVEKKSPIFEVNDQITESKTLSVVDSEQVIERSPSPIESTKMKTPSPVVNSEQVIERPLLPIERSETIAEMKPLSPDKNSEEIIERNSPSSVKYDNEATDCKSHSAIINKKLIIERKIPSPIKDCIKNAEIESSLSISDSEQKLHIKLPSSENTAQISCIKSPLYNDNNDEAVNREYHSAENKSTEDSLKRFDTDVINNKDLTEKDDESDPVLIPHENVPHVDKEKIDNTEQNVKSGEEIINANSSFEQCKSPTKNIEIVDLDDEEKRDSCSKKTLDTTAKKEVENVGIKDNKNMSANEMETIELDEEKESITVESMEIDTSVQENRENMTNNKEESMAMEQDKVFTLSDNEENCNEKSFECKSNEMDNIIDIDRIRSEKHENGKHKMDVAEGNEIFDVDDDREQNKKDENPSPQKSESLKNNLSEDLKNTPSVLKLSNNLDILSDEEEEPSVIPEKKSSTLEKQSINIEDDDDIMLIEEDTANKDNKNEPSVQSEIIPEPEKNINNEAKEKESNEENIANEVPAETEKSETKIEESETEKEEKAPPSTVETSKPLVPSNFLKTYKKNLADMTREDLEEFCILKIVESIVDRSNLSEIRSKLKAMAQNIEEYKKKAMVLTKQNRDLQVVLKSVQEEQKKNTGMPITPLKITRSVGMQVLMTDKFGMRRKGLSIPNPTQNMNNNPNSKPPRRPGKTPPVSQSIPVPRLVPAAISPAAKTSNTVPAANTTLKPASPLNGVKNTTSAQKAAEKRTHTRMQSQSQSQSVTVDLTDDEPPAKVATRNSPAPPVRLVPPQNLLAPQRHPIGQNSPRKVYIPISGPGQGQPIRPGQTIMLKPVSPQNQGPRPRGPPPQITRMPQNQVRLPRIQNRHPAPLPESMKQYQASHWKALPPAPDLKLSKVENGIVISWKIEGYHEDSYEEIASYQLYAYQETNSPPSTALWKKIGDVKALPLPMACTLTQFMAGFKYYFAVRAVDIRSRLGPFSLPGSILLLNKI